ncbi:MAG TPA: hypothetical protein PKI14_13775 [Fervidobacterium sp.]|nr:hypothetical protein [Fervidobacterium sp.]
MKREEREIEFNERERLSGLNHIELDEYGDFYAELILPEDSVLYGWWYPTKDCLQEMNDEKDEHKNIEDAPFWARIDYIPLNSDLDEEDRLLNDPDASASDFLELGWFYWEIDFAD